MESYSLVRKQEVVKPNKSNKKKDKKMKGVKVKKKKEKVYDALEDVYYHTKKTCMKSLKGFRKNDKCESFHSILDTNFIVYNSDDKPIKEIKGMFKRKKLKNILKEYPDAKILMCIKNGYYKMVSLQTVINLMKINKMIINCTDIIYVDGDMEDPFIHSDNQYRISSISQLLDFCMRKDIHCDFIQTLTMDLYWYDTFDSLINITIEMDNKEVIYYSRKKGMRAFLEDFDCKDLF